MPRQGRGTLLTGVRPFPLTALRHPTVATLLDDHRALLGDLLDGLGSPLHVVLPEVFEENIARLRQAFAETGADVDILFAKKANKAGCFVSSAAALGAGIDAASSAELVKALAGECRDTGSASPARRRTTHCTPSPSGTTAWSQSIRSANSTGWPRPRGSRTGGSGCCCERGRAVNRAAGSGWPPPSGTRPSDCAWSSPTT